MIEYRALCHLHHYQASSVWPIQKQAINPFNPSVFTLLLGITLSVMSIARHAFIAYFPCIISLHMRSAYLHFHERR